MSLFLLYFQCGSVDRQDAVVTFNHYLSKFKVKELIL